ncbi:hypothetical protein PTTG_27572 [Puccinia triticina 1-1 BBBD Race 1]|uniref:DUF7918 domain-containing protein n=1 Tax=Puccinia triticina (isolate 1-1 / race 1 (BBBD)) TaxID=630390 RepID=A0A180GJJ0_PUCT1|nr:hypothetical protein PTTG_27572 [Puccinia triticina 1-1 BBBD Race 1]
MWPDVALVDLDGIPVSQRRIPRTQSGRRTFSQVSTKSSDLRLRATRPYQFAPIKLVDPDEQQELCQDENIIKSLGTIELRIYRCKLLATLRQENTSAFKTTNEMSFSESSKNARLTSTAGLGKPAIKERKHKTQYVIRKIADHPFLHFVFQYKPRLISLAKGSFQILSCLLNLQ